MCLHVIFFLFVFLAEPDARLAAVMGSFVAVAKPRLSALQEALSRAETSSKEA